MNLKNQNVGSKFFSFVEKDQNLLLSSRFGDLYERGGGGGGEGYLFKWNSFFAFKMFFGGLYSEFSTVLLLFPTLSFLNRTHFVLFFMVNAATSLSFLYLFLVER